MDFAIGGYILNAWLRRRRLLMVVVAIRQLVPFLYYYYYYSPTIEEKNIVRFDSSCSVCSSMSNASGRSDNLIHASVVCSSSSECDGERRRGFV